MLRDQYDLSKFSFALGMVEDKYSLTTKVSIKLAAIQYSPEHGSGRGIRLFVAPKWSWSERRQDARLGN